MPFHFTCKQIILKLSVDFKHGLSSFSRIVLIKALMLLFTYLIGSVGSALLARFSADSCSHLKCKLQSNPAAEIEKEKERGRSMKIFLL